MDDLDQKVLEEKTWNDQKVKQDEEKQPAPTENDNPAPKVAGGEEDEEDGEEEVGAEQGEDVKQQNDLGSITHLRMMGCS